MPRNPFNFCRGLGGGCPPSASTIGRVAEKQLRILHFGLVCPARLPRSRV